MRDTKRTLINEAREFREELTASPLPQGKIPYELDEALENEPSYVRKAIGFIAGTSNLTSHQVSSRYYELDLLAEAIHASWAIEQFALGMKWGSNSRHWYDKRLLPLTWLEITSEKDFKYAMIKAYEVMELMSMCGYSIQPP